MNVEERLDELERQVADLRAKLLGVAEYCTRVLDQAPRRRAPGPDTEALGLSDCFTGTRPVAYSLLGERHEVTNFKAILLGVCDALYERHRAEFQRALSLSGFSRDPGNLGRTGAPHEIAHSGVHVATNRSANDLMAKCRELLELFGHSAGDIEVEVRAR